MQQLDIIIPCYNEKDNIRTIYGAIADVMQEAENVSFSVIYIDDGSSDDTMAEILALESEYGCAKVKYISFSRNFGKESAIYAGLQASSGDYAVLMDADHQDPPALLPAMLAVLMRHESGEDCVAVRRIDRKGEPIARSWFANRFYALMNKFSDVKMEPGARDFRMMTAQMRDSILALSERERFSKGLFAWVGFKTKWLELPNVPRAAGETKWSFWGLFKYALSGIVAFTTAPLRIASFAGVLTVLMAIIYAVYRLIRWQALFTTDAIIIFIVLFFSGVTVSFLGIIGEYIARIYREVKQRPVYIIAKSNIKVKMVDRRMDSGIKPE
jgi:glycosyltransferase involved in cell wall biosynthesis